MEEADELLLVLTTLADEDAAAALGRRAVESRLAACASCVPGARSIYRYRGRVEDERECLLLLKTRRARYAALEDWLEAEHPYDVPEIVALRADAVATPYARWLMEQTRDQ